MHRSYSCTCYERKILHSRLLRTFSRIFQPVYCTDRFLKCTQQVDRGRTGLLVYVLKYIFDSCHLSLQLTCIGDAPLLRHFASRPLFVL